MQHTQFLFSPPILLQSFLLLLRKSFMKHKSLYLSQHGVFISLCSWSAWLWWYSVQTVTGTTGGYQELEHLKSLWQWQYGWGQLHGIGPFRDNKWLSTHMHSRWGPRVGLVMQPLLASPLTHPTGSLRVRARAREWNYFFFFLSVLKCDNTFVLHSWYVHSMMVTM